MSIFSAIIDATRKKPKIEVNPEPLVPPTGNIPVLDTGQTRFDTVAQALGITGGSAARYLDFEQMDSGDIAALLDAVCDAALTFDESSTADYSEVGRPKGFKIQSEKRATIKNIEDILIKTKLKDKMWMYLRDGLKYGDIFLEFLADRKEGLVGLQSYAPSSIRVYTDDHNRLLTGTDSDSGFPYPYIQLQQVQGQVTSTKVAGWAPWEMLHWKWMPHDRYAYSYKSLLDDYRPDWKKLVSLETAMVVARIVRAYTRNVHYLDTTGLPPAEQQRVLAEYVRRTSFSNRRARNTTVAPDEELYMTTGYIADNSGHMHPRQSKIEVIDPKGNGLSRIADIEYQRRKLFSRVPGEVVGIQDNTLQSDITAQDLAFSRLIRYVQVRGEELVRDVVDTGLLLQGVDPANVRYDLVWPKTINSNWKLADAQFRIALAMTAYANLGASREEIFGRAWNQSPPETEAMLKKWQDENDTYGAVNATDTNRTVGGNQSTGLDKTAMDDIAEFLKKQSRASV